MVDLAQIRKGIELGRLVISATSAHLPLRGERVCVGRCSRMSQLVVAGPTVSRCHCQLALCDGQIYIEDLGSRNGTWLNGVRIRHALLSTGSVVHLGLERFVFEQTLSTVNLSTTCTVSP
jgi:pSer/pThr/pTyr-binding forkhead associated (FHA) protein